MLYHGAKKEALANHGRAMDAYDTIYAKAQTSCDALCDIRQQSVFLIEQAEGLVNSIANTPKQFRRSLSVIEAERLDFRKTECYTRELLQSAAISAVGIAAGVGAGAAIVTSNAALAGLGGGSMVTLLKRLKLPGWAGWGLSAVTVVGSAAVFCYENKKISDKLIAELQKIAAEGARLREFDEMVSDIHNRTALLLEKVKTQLAEMEHLRHFEYVSLCGATQLRLGALVNNTLSLAQLLNMTSRIGVEK